MESRFKIGDRVSYEYYKGVVSGSSMTKSGRLLHDVQFGVAGTLNINMYDDNPHLTHRYDDNDFDLGDLQ